MHSFKHENYIEKIHENCKEYDFSSAIFSKCEKYRYSLLRTWNNNMQNGYAMFIGLNPSTADEKINDPTVRRCIGFARDWGFDGLLMANIFAFRATLPEDMKKQSNPIGDLNDYFIQYFAKDAEIIIGAWGTHGKYLNRQDRVLELIPNLCCLGKNNDGTPKHPLYLSKTLKPIGF